MKRFSIASRIAAIIISTLLLAGCATPTPAPTDTATQIAPRPAETETPTTIRAFSPTHAATVGEGTISVLPTTVLADSFGTLSFKFTVGASGMGRGGGLSLQFPTRRDRTQPLLWDVCQSENPDERGYVEAWVDGTNTDGDIAIECARKGVLNLIIEGRALSPGEEIRFSYTGNVQAMARPLILRVSSRWNEHDSWKILSTLPEIQILPAEAEFLLVVTPADVEKDSDFALAVTVLDRFGNRSTDYRGTVSFASSDADAHLPPPHAFTGEDAGVYVFGGAQYRTLGFHKITVTDGALTGHSNYSHVVGPSSFGYGRYFGDTHFHTGTGAGNVGGVQECAGDHRGNYTTEEEAYSYARDVMRLDFASASEHDAQVFTGGLWLTSQAITESFYQPGVFTTFFAYEWTSWGTGHRLVMYRDQGNEIYRNKDDSYDTPIELWAALEEQGAPFIVIPHVMGEWTEEFETHPLWTKVNNECQPIGEIYSHHNLVHRGGVLSDNPQRFELGLDATWSYQYAWHKGHKIGLIGSSDNHLGTPGTDDFTPSVGHPGGLAVALAERNDREAVWDALVNRRTYATTGTRIFLDFQIDGHPMGDEFESTTDPAITVVVGGTDKLEKVELVKHDGSGYAVIYVDEPGGEISSFEYVDADFEETSFYYVRAIQVDGEMAWSSPIWVTLGPE